MNFLSLNLEKECKIFRSPEDGIQDLRSQGSPRESDLETQVKTTPRKTNLDIGTLDGIETTIIARREESKVSVDGKVTTKR